MRRRAALGVAAGGVLLGHAVTYDLLDPNAHQRAADLARTGHAYLGLANDLGLVAALVALSAVFLGGLTRRDTDDSRGFRPLATRLVTFQVAAFVGMEVLERLSAGAPVLGVLHQGILPVGIAVQAAVALIGALVIAWLVRAAERIASTHDAAPAVPRRAAALVLPVLHVPARPILATAGIRGPPPLTSPR